MNLKYEQVALEEAMQTVFDELKQGTTQPEEALSNGIAYVDGAFMPANEATVPLLDWGFTRSDAFQDTVSFWGGYFFRLDDHIERFYRSAARLRMSPPPENEVRAVLHELVDRGGYRSAYVQFLMTRGVPPLGSRDVRSCVNRFRAFAIPYVWIAKPEVQKRGLRVHLSQRRRVPPASVDPQVKHYHWLDFELGLFDAYDRDYETVLLRDVDGGVAEGPGFNMFIVCNGELKTPPANFVLDGMTRRTVIELAQELQLRVVEAPVWPDDLASADEMFLSTTAGGVMPVASVDGTAIGSSRPGPVTSRLHETYWRRRTEGWLGTPLIKSGDSKG